MDNKEVVNRRWVRWFRVRKMRRKAVRREDDDDHG